MTPTIFDFKGNNVRIAFDEYNNPLFCLADVCKALHISRTSRLLRELDTKGLADCHIPTNGGMQKLIFISEPNLYRVIFRSTKPEALNFQNWVFADVLPSIRKTGSYSVRRAAYDELNHLCMQAKAQKAKGSFHGTGLVNHRYSMQDLNLRIATCRANLQLAFEGLCND